MFFKNKAFRCLLFSCVVLLVLLTAEARKKKKQCGKPKKNLLKNAVMLIVDSPVNGFSRNSTNSLHGDVLERAVAPWKWRRNHDVTRIPATIFEAECSTTYCTIIKGQQDMNYNTKVIKQEMMVLQLDLQLSKPGCKSVYRLVRMTFAVGCFCVHARVI
ncbi:interleukin 17a/f2 [Amia ocellicauda]|uniref:interleukin 17a/f2 n=1 Tax=Amia ocellicauda TaxID=2972642 RepID=UPI003463FF43